MTTPQPILTDMNDRTREVFRRVVEGYLTSGEPVGSRTLTRSLSEKLSAATVRNVMQDLEYLGLLDSPHISAGRIPTQAGLRMFVDSLLEVGQVAPEDQEKIDATLGTNDQDVASLLDEVGAALSVITRGASVVQSGISSLSVWRPTGRWWCWFSRTGRWKTGCSPLRRGRRRPRCARRRIS
jgi:heat-inducible transcriptional repressor